MPHIYPLPLPPPLLPVARWSLSPLPVKSRFLSTAFHANDCQDLDSRKHLIDAFLQSGSTCGDIFSGLDRTAFLKDSVPKGVREGTCCPVPRAVCGLCCLLFVPLCRAASLCRAKVSCGRARLRGAFPTCVCALGAARLQQER